MALTTRIMLRGDKMAADRLRLRHCYRLLEEFRRITKFQNLRQNERLIRFDDGSMVHMATRFDQETVQFYAPTSAAVTVQEAKGSNPLVIRAVSGPSKTPFISPAGEWLYSPDNRICFTTAEKYAAASGTLGAWGGDPPDWLPVSVTPSSQQYILHSNYLRGYKDTQLSENWLMQEGETTIGDTSVYKQRTPKGWRADARGNHSGVAEDDFPSEDEIWLLRETDQEFQETSGELLLFLNPEVEGSYQKHVVVTFAKGDSALNPEPFMTLEFELFGMYDWATYPEHYPPDHQRSNYPIKVAWVDFENKTVRKADDARVTDTTLLRPWNFNTDSFFA